MTGMNASGLETVVDDPVRNFASQAFLSERCGSQEELDSCSSLSIQLGSIRGGLASTSLPERFALAILTPRPDLIRPEPPDSVGTLSKSWILPCWRAVWEDQPAEGTLSTLPAHSVVVYFPAAEDLGRLFHTLQALCPSVADRSTLSRRQ
ncbi:hypothetical protein ILYODFUR_027774 [Ilyodon furcidens]|uniref:Uncharacterized protein n=1 Tax=Ilyodon furcidens TaxID=33524 RepID=A0ABV0TYM2_9TELE